jgi:FixJ family two-component response regulator
MRYRDNRETYRRIPVIAGGTDVPTVRDSTDPNAISEEPIVLVIDDDRSVCIAIENLLRSVRLRVQTYNSAQSFFQAPLPTAPTCLVLDVRLPGQSGLDLQSELIREEVRIPIIFLTAHGDVRMSVRALKAGAIDFLIKPFSNQDLLDAVNSALFLAHKQHEEDKKISDLRDSFNTLSRREQQIMGLVTDGLMNKQIGHEIGISEMTVKIYRGNVMRKMKAKSLPSLVRMAETLGLRGV